VAVVFSLLPLNGLLRVILLGMATLAIDLWAAFRPHLRAPFWIKGTAWGLTVVAIIVLAPENVGSFIYFQF
jgi:hypothetical protein